MFSVSCTTTIPLHSVIFGINLVSSQINSRHGLQLIPHVHIVTHHNDSYCNSTQLSIYITLGLTFFEARDSKRASVVCLSYSCIAFNDIDLVIEVPRKCTFLMALPLVLSSSMNAIFRITATMISRITLHLRKVSYKPRPIAGVPLRTMGKTDGYGT